MDITHAKDTESEKQEITLLSQVKHIRDDFTKKLDELNSKIKIIQFAVESLSQTALMINKNMETLQYSSFASVEYHQVIMWSLCIKMYS